MIHRADTIMNKSSELGKLRDTELIDRIRSFPDKDLLDKEIHLGTHKFSVSKIIENYDGQALKKNQRIRLIEGFSRITTLGVGLQETPSMPDNVKGTSMWHPYKGRFEGLLVSFSLTEEELGKIGVNVVTTDSEIVNIGYLDKEFVNKYSVKGDRIVEGSYYNGDVELVFDAEKLYDESMSKLISGSCHVYEKQFNVSNVSPDEQKAFDEIMQRLIGDSLEHSSDKRIIEGSFVFDCSNYDNEYIVRIKSIEPMGGRDLLYFDDFFDNFVKSGKSAANVNSYGHIYPENTFIEVAANDPTNRQEIDDFTEAVAGIPADDKCLTQ